VTGGPQGQVTQGETTWLMRQQLVSD